MLVPKDKQLFEPKWLNAVQQSLLKWSPILEQYVTPCQRICVNQFKDCRLSLLCSGDFKFPRVYLFHFWYCIIAKTSASQFSPLFHYFLYLSDTTALYRLFHTPLTYCTADAKKSFGLVKDCWAIKRKRLTWTTTIWILKLMQLQHDVSSQYSITQHNNH